MEERWSASGGAFPTCTARVCSTSNSAKADPTRWIHQHNTWGDWRCTSVSRFFVFSDCLKTFYIAVTLASLGLATEGLGNIVKEGQIAWVIGWVCPQNTAKYYQNKIYQNTLEYRALKVLTFIKWLTPGHVVLDIGNASTWKLLWSQFPAHALAQLGGKDWFIFTSFPNTKSLTVKETQTMKDLIDWVQVRVLVRVSIIYMTMIWRYRCIVYNILTVPSRVGDSPPSHPFLLWHEDRLVPHTLGRAARGGHVVHPGDKVHLRLTNEWPHGCVDSISWGSVFQNIWDIVT